MTSTISLRSGDEYHVDDELEDLLTRINDALESDSPHATVRCQVAFSRHPGLPGRYIVIRADAIQAVTGQAT